jgi:hypothetical protein
MKITYEEPSMKKEQKNEIRAACASLAEAIISAVGNAKANLEPIDRAAAKVEKAAREAEATHKLIQKTFFQTSEKWTGTAENLCRIALASPAATETDKELFRAVNWTGRRLAALAVRFPDCYIRHKTRDSIIWKLRAVKG